MNQQRIIPKSNVFEPLKDFNSNYFRIPFLDITNQGTLIAGSDVRYIDGSDYNQIDIGIARSIDGGHTWINKQIVHSHATDHEHSRKMDGAILIDHHTGRIFIFALSLDLHRHLQATNNQHQSFVYKYSDDDGITWSEEVSLRHFYDEDAILYFEGPGNGIQLEDGTLVLPIQRWVSQDHPIQVQAGIIYSKDHGNTWHKSHTLVPLRSSESAIIEYAPNQILISSRDDFSTGRHFYTTNDLGNTWSSHETSGTIWENGGCQATMLKIKAPNGKHYGLYATPQHTNDVVWQRSKLTLMATEDFIKWNQVAEIVHDANDGYSCLAYNEKQESLFLLTEKKGIITLNNISCYLPHIMQNTTTYDNQYISTCHRQPLYSQGHYISTTQAGSWYYLLTTQLKPNSYLLLKLDLLGLKSTATITLQLQQTQENYHDLENSLFTLSHIQGPLLPSQLLLVPSTSADGYFTYDLYYQATNTDTFLSLSVVNCLYSEHDAVKLKISTSQRDVRYENFILRDSNSHDLLPPMTPKLL